MFIWLLLALQNDMADHIWPPALKFATCGVEHEIIESNLRLGQKIMLAV